MKKFLSCTLVLAGLLPGVALAQTPTEDFAAAEYALEQEILFPHLDGEFHAKARVTRLEFTLATVDELYTSAKDNDGCFKNMAPSRSARYSLLFKDVPRDSWYGKRLCVAMHVGLISGDREGNFRPFASITNAEASKILAKAYGLTYPTTGELQRPWYWSSMTALSRRGAMPATAVPHLILSRQSMATMFYALRNQPRFPESRIIGSRTPQVSPLAVRAPVPSRVSAAPAPLRQRAAVVVPVATCETALLETSATINCEKSSSSVSQEHASLSGEHAFGVRTSPLSRPSRRVIREQVRMRSEKTTFIR